MLIENVLVRENELMDNGNLDIQIMVDIMKYIKKRKDYQTEHLDKIIKEQKHPSYENWTSDNQKKIVYMERILEMVTLGLTVEQKEYLKLNPMICGASGTSKCH